MNVYAIKAGGHYGAGMAIVAAENEAQAKGLAVAAEQSPWRIDYHQPDSIEVLPCAYSGPPRVLVQHEAGE